MSVSVKVKRTLWKRDKGCCFYCGMSLTWNSKTVDHVIPKSKGGPHRAWNLVIACQPCNKAKGDSSPTPAQMDVVLRRKILHETRISIGQAIELCKRGANPDEVERLIELQDEVSKMILIGSLPEDFMVVLKNKGDNDGR